MTFDDVIRHERCYDVAETLGVKVCFEASVPVSNSGDQPMFLFTGPTSVEVYIQKEDTFEKYHLEAAYIFVLVSYLNIN